MRGGKGNMCSTCLNEHITELVQAGCNDTQAGSYCGGPPPAHDDEVHLVVAVSNDDAQSWTFRSEVPLYSENATASQWQCGLSPIDAQVVSVLEGSLPTLLIVWQPQALESDFYTSMCSARSWDGGYSWTPTHQLHARTAANGWGFEGAPPKAAGVAPRLATLGGLSGVALLTGQNGPGLSLIHISEPTRPY